MENVSPQSDILSGFMNIKICWKHARLELRFIQSRTICCCRQCYSMYSIACMVCHAQTVQHELQPLYLIFALLARQKCQTN